MAKMTKKQKQAKLRELQLEMDYLLSEIDDMQNQVEEVETKIKKIEAMETSDPTPKDKIAKLEKSFHIKIKKIQDNCKHKWEVSCTPYDRDEVCSNCGLQRKNTG